LEPDPGEQSLLLIERAALLSEVPQSAVDGANGASDQVHFLSGDPRVRVTPSFGIASLISNAVVDLRDATNGDTHPRARAGRLLVTNRRILAAAQSGGTTQVRYDDPLFEVTHSDSEPCTVVSANGAYIAAVVPQAEADHLRAAIADGLAQFDNAAQPTVEVPLSQEFAPGEVPESVAEPQDMDEVAGVEPEPISSDHGRAVERQHRRRLRPDYEVGDRIFRMGAWAGGLSVLAIMVIVGLFLFIRALDALRATGVSFLTTQEWQPDVHHFGIAAVLAFTVFIAIVALIVSVPLATGTALFISEVSPRRFKQLFIAMVDLMAAVPSIVYGLWGLFFFQGHVIGLSRWLATWFAWIPIFKVTGADPTNPLASQSVFTASTFIAGTVVALMVIPIACSIMREVFSQAPPGEREGAYALGATRWGMIRTVVLPFGKGGMIGAIMLGLGRALGETIAVYLIISPVFNINWHILQSGSNSVASLIVLRQGDASGFGLSALMAAGLSLFILTLIINFAASAIIARSRSGAESEV
jgi:phosphate transport system permease protein